MSWVTAKAARADLGAGPGVKDRGNWSSTEQQQLDWGQEEAHWLCALPLPSTPAGVAGAGARKQWAQVAENRGQAADGGCPACLSPVHILLSGQQGDFDRCGLPQSCKACGPNIPVSKTPFSQGPAYQWKH